MAKIKVVFTMANNSTAPYFLWFAEEASKRDDIELIFVMLTEEKPILPEQVEKFNCKGYWVPFDFRRRRTQMIKAVPKLYRLFRKLKPDVVHTHLFDDSVPALLAARLAGIKVRAITKGDTFYHYNFAPKWVKFDKYNNRNAHFVIAPATEAYDFILNKEKCPPAKLKMIHTRIPVKYFTEDKPQVTEQLRQKYLGNDNRFVVGTMARFIEWKGYKTLVAAAEIVLRKHKDIVFLLMGEGEQKLEIEKRVEEKGISDHFIFGGRVDNALLPSFYPLYDVFVHPAFMEPGGFVIMETMAVGLPIVSMPTGTAKDGIIHKQNGWLSEYQNPLSVAEGIIYFYENRMPKPWLEPRKTAFEKFDFQLMVDAYMNLYRTKIS